MLSVTVIGRCLSLDNTFRSAAKATIVEKDRARTKLFKGGILSVINKRSEILGWVSNKVFLYLIEGLKRHQCFCLSASPDEITEFLQGYMRRCQMLRVAPPEMVIIDNCCNMRNAIQKAIAGVPVRLDVHHFVNR